MWDGLGHLKELAFGLNNLQTLPDGAFRPLKSLKKLFLQYTSLTSIRKEIWEGLSSLKWLLLESNAIQFLPSGTFRPLTKLRWLGLKYNQLKEIRGNMWTGLTNLRKIELHFTGIHTLHPGAFRPLEKLRKLGMNGIPRARVRADMWEGVNSLEELSLWGSNISSIQREGFSPLPSIQKLLWSDMTLTTLKRNVFISHDSARQRPRNLTLTIDGNPLHCDRPLCWMKSGQERGWLHFTIPTDYLGPPECVNYPGEPWSGITLDCSKDSP